MCVPERWLCDGDKDCADGADESVAAGCCEWRGPKEWGGRCVATGPLCRRGNRGHGEQGVTQAAVAELYPQSRCPDVLSSALPALLLTPREGRGVTLSSRSVGAEGLCLPLSTVYNSTCDDREFMCQNRQCIPKHFMCDHDRDCADGSDESPECGEPGAAAGGGPALSAQAASLTCPLQPQSTQPAAPTRSAAPMGAA